MYESGGLELGLICSVAGFAEEHNCPYTIKKRIIGRGKTSTVISVGKSLEEGKMQKVFKHRIVTIKGIEVFCEQSTWYAGENNSPGAKELYGDFIEYMKGRGMVFRNGVAGIRTE